MKKLDDYTQLLNKWVVGRLAAPNPHHVSTYAQQKVRPSYSVTWTVATITRTWYYCT